MTPRRRVPSALIATVLAASASASAVPAGALTAVGAGSLVEPIALEPTVDEGLATQGGIENLPAGEDLEDLGDLVTAVEGVVGQLPEPIGRAPEPPADHPPAAPAPGEGGDAGDPAPAPSEEAGPAAGPPATGSGRTVAPADDGAAAIRSSAAPVAGPAATSAIDVRVTALPAAALAESSGATSAPSGFPRSLRFHLPDADRFSATRPASDRRPSGPRSTAPILDLLERLALTPAQLAKVLAPFPVAGRATYAEGSGPDGIDILAAIGTPVIASTAGTVDQLRGASGRNGASLRLTGPDRTEYVYADLARIQGGLADGARVSKGQVLGFIGRPSGATAAASHLHFALRPRGGAAVSPVPFLDRWLDEASATARSLERAPDGTLSLRVAGGRRSVLSASAPSPAAAVSPSPVDGAIHHMAAAATVGTDAAPWAGVIVGGALLAWLGAKWPFGRRRRPGGSVTADPVAGLLDLG